MKNKKGFTLIELLAVILILGVISLIAVPVINNIVESAKKSSFKASVGNVVKAIEQQCQVESLKSDTITNLYIFNEEGSSVDINVKGSLPTDGKIEVNSECNTKVNVSDNNFQARKTFDETDLVITDLSSKFIENLEFYYLGDSIIEGYTNDYKGIAYYMENLYDANTARDYSVSGSYLTSPSGVPFIYTQFTNMIPRLSASTSYGNNTVILFDGGGNDFLNASTYNITFTGNGSAETDYYVAITTYLSALVDIQNTNNVNHPIIYVLPRFITADGEAKESYNFWITTTKSYIASFNIPNILVLDLNEVLEDSDIKEDCVHIKDSGYKKFAKAVYDMLDKYYN